MHNVLIISYIAFSIGNLFILPESWLETGGFFIETFREAVFGNIPPDGSADPLPRSIGPFPGLLRSFGKDVRRVPVGEACHSPLPYRTRGCLRKGNPLQAY